MQEDRKPFEIIDEFTNAQAGSVLSRQITAGGVGLNIQAANIDLLEIDEQASKSLMKILTIL